LLTIWDTNYGVIQGTKEISHEASETSKTAGGILASAPSEQAQLRQVVLSNDQNLMLFNLGQSVVVNPVWVLSSSLASVLGNLTATQKYLVDDSGAEVANNQQFNLYSHLADPKRQRTPAVISVDDSDAMDVDSAAKAIKERAKISEDALEGFVVSENTDEIWKSVVAPAQNKESETIDILTNRTKTPTLESFMAVFEPFMQQVKEKSHIVLKQAIKDTQVTEESKTWKNLHQYSRSLHEKQQKKKRSELLGTSTLGVSQQFMCRVAMRCLEEDFLWEPLKRLLESRAFSCRSVPTLIPTLMEKQQLVRFRLSLSLFHGRSANWYDHFFFNMM
jgi:hypothetical protein